MIETEITSKVREHLQDLENLGRLVYIRNNTGMFRKGKSYVRVGKEGSPDFLIFLRNGATIHLEIKKSDTKQNENQIKYQEIIEKLNHKYIVIINLSELDKILQEYV